MKAIELRVIAINAQITGSAEVSAVLNDLLIAAQSGIRKVTLNYSISADSENLLEELGYVVTPGVGNTVVKF